MQLILELERDEIEALLEDVTFDSGLDYHAGGHPASTRLLSKIEKAIGVAYGGITVEQFFAQNAANALDHAHLLVCTEGGNLCASSARKL
jgi:hypothetical protein